MMDTESYPNLPEDYDFSYYQPYFGLNRTLVKKPFIENQMILPMKAKKHGKQLIKE
ncbi:hypothetical protein QBE55_05140 [Eubacteriales bacterium mix99]|jgi:hypothetical protein